VERLFEIADPKNHHLVLICDLSAKHPYQAHLLEMASKSPWVGNVTVTGFQSALRVGEILAVADAVIFPFPNGAGGWNTSLKAAEAAGAFTIATTQDSNLWGYNEERNIYFAACDDVLDMREAVSLYLGHRVEPKFGDEWARIASDHERIYRLLCQ
jgi:glycosyltransferase involved in cell wall biosynthesis